MDDLRIEWPWSLEEEIEWKSRLAERDAEPADLIEVEVEPTQASDIVQPEEATVAENAAAEKYMVTA